MAAALLAVSVPGEVSSAPLSDPELRNKLRITAASDGPKPWSAVARRSPPSNWNDDVDGQENRGISAAFHSDEVLDIKYRYYRYFK